MLAMLRLKLFNGVALAELAAANVVPNLATQSADVRTVPLVVTGVKPPSGAPSSPIKPAVIVARFTSSPASKATSSVSIAHPTYFLTSVSLSLHYVAVNGVLPLTDV